MPDAKLKAAIPHWPLLAMLLFVIPAAASANGASPAEMQSGSLLMHMQDGYETAVLLNTDVAITVNGLVARVSVMQEFQNTGSDWAEGLYVFPLPDTAAVDHMRMYIGERFIEGEIREKAEARAQYELAKQAGKKTSLVEQQRANLFTTSVANIAPGETVIVEIEYLEDVRYDDGTFSIRYPMTLTPRYSPGPGSPGQRGNDVASDVDPVGDDPLILPPMATVAGGHKVSIRADLNAGMPLGIVASRYHPVNVSETGGRYLVSLAGARVAMDRDFELLWRPVPAAVPRAMVFGETVGGQPYYLLMVVPPGDGTAPAVHVPREMIFVIDTSGSMHGESIEQAKQAVQGALGQLQPGDAFNVIEFNSRTRVLFSASVAAMPANISMAQNFVRQLNSNGGTEMYPALQAALGMPRHAGLLRQIIFVTDGAVGNEEELFRLIGKDLGDARLFTVGIGSAPNSWFMRKAAEAGRGTFTVISALHEVGEKMDRLFRKLERPQVTGIEIDWPSGTTFDSYPAVVPDLYAGEPVTVRAKASTAVRPGDHVTLSGNSISGAWSGELSLAIDRQSTGVGALWARARIGSLLDAERRGADAQATRDGIVATALLHHLVSKYTSLVAVDKTPARVAGDLLKREQLASLTPHGQNASAVSAFPATATNAPALRSSGLLTLVVGLLLLASYRAHRGLRHGHAV